MSSTKTFFLILTAFCAVLGLLAYRILSSPYHDQQIMGNVTIDSEWLEIVLTRPLEPERQVQEIVLDIDKPVKADVNSLNLLFPDGSIGSPEVQLVDQQGNNYSLGEHSFIINPNSKEPLPMGFSMREFPKDKVYRMVRIRSDKPFKCSRIYWRNYNQWERK